MDRKRGSRSGSPQHKRQKVTHDTTHSSPAPLTADTHGAKKSGAESCTGNLATGLLDRENVERLRQEYADSEPYKYARIETLFQDDLLRKVKDECLTHLSFTEKETDIYRVSPPVLRFAIPPPCVGVYVLSARVLRTPARSDSPVVGFFSRVDPSPCFAFVIPADSAPPSFCSLLDRVVDASLICNMDRHT